MKLHPLFLKKKFNTGHFHIVQPKTFASLTLISLVKFLYDLISLVKLRELVFHTCFDH